MLWYVVIYTIALGLVLSISLCDVLLYTAKAAWWWSTRTARPKWHHAWLNLLFFHLSICPSSLHIDFSLFFTYCNICTTHRRYFYLGSVMDQNQSQVENYLLSLSAFAYEIHLNESSWNRNAPNKISIRQTHTHPAWTLSDHIEPAIHTCSDEHTVSPDIWIGNSHTPNNFNALKHGHLSSIYISCRRQACARHAGSSAPFIILLTHRWISLRETTVVHRSLIILVSRSMHDRIDKKMVLVKHVWRVVPVPTRTALLLVGCDLWRRLYWPLTCRFASPFWDASAIPLAAQPNSSRVLV
jgi:hypothetical protein